MMIQVLPLLLVQAISTIIKFAAAEKSGQVVLSNYGPESLQVSILIV